MKLNKNFKRIRVNVNKDFAIPDRSVCVVHGRYNQCDFLKWRDVYYYEPIPKDNFYCALFQSRENGSLSFKQKLYDDEYEVIAVRKCKECREAIKKQKQTEKYINELKDKANSTWMGVNVDEYMDEVKGRE